jgi:hypothetical protein
MEAIEQQQRMWNAGSTVLLATGKHAAGIRDHRPRKICGAASYGSRRNSAHGGRRQGAAHRRASPAVQRRGMCTDCPMPSVACLCFCRTGWRRL